MAVDDQNLTLEQESLRYHEYPRPGKLEIRATKPMATGRDLALAYSPGVANACLRIAETESESRRYTAKGNLVAVVSNGSAVLGLGNIGAHAAKPVMEGKAVLFKKFADIDCFDIEVNESDPEKLADLVARLEPTFGAVNLEDIKAPDCFRVERLCREKMGIPVFHDDQHGTAIVVAAAASNALILAEKNLADIRIVALGAGAAGIACLKMLLKMGARRENILLCDRAGVVRPDSADLTPEKAEFAQDTEHTTLAEAIVGADLFLGLSGPNLLTADMVRQMADQPIIFALANPDPEILPELALEAAPDALIATGRSDYFNQVNNVLCFPFIFRGAMDACATEINDAMKVACAEALAKLARDTISAEVGTAYQGETLNFGPRYLIPKPFDPRLLPEVSLAVAEAAIASGVATRALDLDEYRSQLQSKVYKTYFLMRPVFDASSRTRRRIVFAEGEDERVLRASQEVIEETGHSPILVGRPEVVERRINILGLAIKPGSDVEIVNPQMDRRFNEYWSEYHGIMRRRGVTPDLAKAVMRTNTTAIAAVMVRRGEADSMICGTFGQYLWHLNYVRQILSERGLHPVGALSLLIFDGGPLFIADTHVHTDPTVEQVTETVIGAARHVRRFGVEPKIALCSDSQFGNLDSLSGRLMRAVMKNLDRGEYDFEYEGEMNTDTAVNEELRERLFPNSRLTGAANTLIYPNTVGAGAARNLLKSVVSGLEVGPILMGMGNRAHIVTPAITVRGLLNIAALAGTDVVSYG
ncbi:MAG: NADP-dependent malic enzyme [Rhodobacteraceae bacterium]|nr:NADP-dependent malic enzyme [Paracoccaceae bacterium]